MRTATTITDSEINEVGLEARADLDRALALPPRSGRRATMLADARERLDAALTAMTVHPLDGKAERSRRRAARKRCAEILNARRGKPTDAVQS